MMYARGNCSRLWRQSLAMPLEDWPGPQGRAKWSRRIPHLRVAASRIVHNSVPLREALRHPAADRTMTSNCWQPIATAPKDGTAVLVFHPAWDTPQVGIHYGGTNAWQSTCGDLLR